MRVIECDQGTAVSSRHELDARNPLQRLTGVTTMTARLP
jgi:hypothetical protein